MVPETLTQLVIWLAAPASVGAVVSWLAEKSPWFQQLSKGWKAAAMLVIALVLGGTAGGINLAVTGSPETTVELLNILFAAAMTGILVLLGSQGWHAYFNQSLKRMEQLPDILKRMNADAGLIQVATLLLAVLQAVQENLPAEGAAAADGQQEGLPLGSRADTF